MSFDLDHVAIGLRDVTQSLFTLVGELGGTPIRGGEVVGFRAMQVRLGDAERGMTVELLEPFDVHLNDFLVRFLERHEHGPHHLTFKVDDIEFELIESIFASRHETAEKILLRDMVQAIGSIANRAENAADRVRIVAIKRKI